MVGAPGDSQELRMGDRYWKPAVTTVLVLLLAIGLVMMDSAPAWATEVIRLTDHFDRAEGGSDSDTDCDADGINDYSIDLDGRITVMLFDDGTVRVHSNWDGRAWVDGGGSVSIHHAFTVTEDPNGTITVIGLPFGVFGDPGGPIVMDAGLVRIGADGVFVAGPHELLEHFGLDANAATCDALGL